MNVVSTIDACLNVYLDDWQVLLKELLHNDVGHTSLKSSANDDEAVRSVDEVFDSLRPIVVLRVTFVEEHAVWGHWRTALLADGNVAEVLGYTILINEGLFCLLFISLIKLLQGRSSLHDATVLLCFIGAVHVIYVSVDLIDVWSECHSVAICQLAVWISGVHQNL